MFLFLFFALGGGVARLVLGLCGSSLWGLFGGRCGGYGAGRRTVRGDGPGLWVAWVCLWSSRPRCGCPWYVGRTIRQCWRAIRDCLFLQKRLGYRRGFA